MATQQAGSTNGIDHYMDIAVDPNGKQILDPYSFKASDIHYFFRNSVGTTRIINIATAHAPDIVSWIEYRTHDYWWLLMVLNKMIRGEQEMVAGITLYLPSLPDLQAYIESLRRKQIGGRIVSLSVTPTTIQGRNTRF